MVNRHIEKNFVQYSNQRNSLNELQVKRIIKYEHISKKEYIIRIINSSIYAGQY